MTRDRAIWTAYAAVDPDQPCPVCGAAPRVWCTNSATGRVRRVPCVDRPLLPADTSASTEGPRDYSEPRHERTDT